MVLGASYLLSKGSDICVSEMHATTRDFKVFVKNGELTKMVRQEAC